MQDSDRESAVRGPVALLPPSIKHSGSVACAGQGSSLGWGPALGCLLLRIPVGAPVAEARATKAEGEGGECRGVASVQCGPGGLTGRLPVHRGAKGDGTGP